MQYKLGVRLSNPVIGSGGENTRLDWYRWLKEVGYDAVDVIELTPDVKGAIDSAGLQLGSFDVRGVAQLFSRNEKVREEAIESINRQIASAASIGGGICFMCLKPEDNEMPRSESFNLYKEVFPAIAATAEKHEVRVVFEGYPGPAPFYPTLGCTPETLRAMFEAVPSTSLCVNYDPSHLIRLGVDHIRFLREFIGQTAHVHAKDCIIDPESVYLYGRTQAAAFGQPVKFSQGPYRYTIPGEGSVNWATVAFELDRAGYRGIVSVELEDHRYCETVEDRRRGLTKGLAHLKHFFH